MHQCPTKNFNVFIKPTLGCNLHCSYCYHNHDGVNQSSEKMNIETLKHIYEKLKNYDSVKITWHGGEPLMMGLHWFKLAIEMQKSYETKFINNFQSNIILLDEDWLQFFKENRFSIGTSLDGVKELHDRVRNNSFDKVVDGIKRLKSEGIQTAAITVISIDSLPYLYESFRLFQDLDLNIRLNPAIKCSGSHRNPETNGKAYEFAAKFIWDLWLGSNRRLEIRPMNYTYNYIKTGRKQSLFGDNCAGGANILPNGDAYICSKFLGNEIGYLGNVNTTEFQFGRLNPVSEKYFLMNADRIEKCRSCLFFNLCRAGCFFNGVMNDYKEDIFCASYKRIFQHVVIRAEQETIK